jgi:hypothetical protein
MAMHWSKLGLVYKPKGELPWAKSHAMVPTPLRLNDDIVRVFITCCDTNGIGRPGYVDVSAKDPCKVIGISEFPLLDIGKPGTFDENGVLVCSVVNLGNGVFYMYYVGFELGTKIRYRLLTGLAISEDGGNKFKKYSTVPVLERSASELFFRCGPYCLYSEEVFRLWYVAGSEWLNINNKEMPVYDLRYIESKDGIHWPNKGEIQMEVTKADEHGFGRPCIFKNNNGEYSLFYSIRRRSFGAYRLGYAESRDGRTWKRMDEQLGLDITPGCFDSEAIMYGAPIEINGTIYLFYNGNDFGREGFAVAKQEKGSL